MNYYTGVGSRNTPKDILLLMESIANKMYKRGFCLRTGDAVGADKAFVRGSQGLRRIYTSKDATIRSMELAEKFHPAWNRMTVFAKKLHGRNSFQVLGDQLDEPSSILICWTPDGCVSHRYRSIKTGGTGTAISIADQFDIRICNLKNDKTRNLLQKWIEG